MKRIATPTGIDNKPKRMVHPHWLEVRGEVEVKSCPTSTIRICSATLMMETKRNIGLV